MILFLDNYDSFTYILADYVRSLGEECSVIRNDEMTLEEMKKLHFGAMIISPGPQTPQKTTNLMEVIEAFHQSIPMLGVCLGHQALGIYFGARLVKTSPRHGYTSDIRHNSKSVFRNLPDPLRVMRYHSWILEDVPEPLEVTALTDEGEIMALRHRTLPLTGVQFHPESILTEEGKQLISNWLEDSAHS